MSKVFYDKPIIDQIFEEFNNKGYKSDQDKLINLVRRLPPEDINKQDKDGSTALTYASYYKCIEIVKLLLEHRDIDINKQDKYESTALTYASSCNCIEIVKLLLEHRDVDINIQNCIGYTALTIAVEGRFIEILELLKKYQKN